MVIDAGVSDEAWLAAAWLVGGGLLVIAWGGARAAGWLRGLRFPGAPASLPPRPFVGKVFVIDGDTIHVRQARVRLFGIDAPELTQRGGWKARSHLIGLAGGREVSVEPMDVDRYGRIVARVRLGGVDLSERMVRDGFARGVTDFCALYGEAELDARRRMRGLWSQSGIADPAAHRRAKTSAAPPR
jgi:endonuclease YncB( thermonuclease family)